MFWCLGMYGSASTWTYYLVQKLAATLIPERPVISRFVYNTLHDIDESAGTVVIKTHAAVVAEELAKRASAIVVTIRDPRDAIASLMAEQKAPFETALNASAATAQLCARFAVDKRTILLRFEDRFYDDPATIRRVARAFGRPLADADRERIFGETRREAIEQFIARLDKLPTAESVIDQVTGQPDTLDGVTGWHKHHAGRKGKIGRWRDELSRAQVTEIEKRAREWMSRFGYRPVTPPYTLTIGKFVVDRQPAPVP